MTPEVQALREQFRDQMPGMAQFYALAEKYEQLLGAQAALEQKWNQASPARVQQLEQTIQDLSKQGK